MPHIAPSFRAFFALLACAGLARAADYNLTVNYASDLGAVSPLLIGTNAIYCNEPDAQWGTSGNIPALLSNVSTGIISADQLSAQPCPCGLVQW